MEKQVLHFCSYVRNHYRHYNLAFGSHHRQSRHPTSYCHFFPPSGATTPIGGCILQSSSGL